jgi:hypothetical protein
LEHFVTDGTEQLGKRPDDVLTFGVEEEFFVADRHGHLSQAGSNVVDAADDELRCWTVRA